MTRSPRLFRQLLQLSYLLLTLLGDVVRFLRFCLRSPAALAAENLFLRKQFTLYQERHITPRRATNATRLALVWLGRWFDGRQALAVVQPATFTRWHREGFRLFWRWKSHPGRPRSPATLQALIRQMARDNLTWGEERITHELVLQLGLRVSPRTVRKYMPKRWEHGRSTRARSQRWQTFVLMEHATRRILHVNVTAHPTASWTLQQLREAIPADHDYRFLMHDHDAIFSRDRDQHARNLRLRVLKTPPHSPQANALCERLIGTLRRECLDFVIACTEHHLRCIVHAWVPHYHGGRPHMALGPGLPQPPPPLPALLQAHRHCLPEHLRVVVRPLLGGLHYDYRLETQAA